MTDSPFRTTAAVADHKTPSPHTVPVNGRDKTISPADTVVPAVMTDEQPLGKALAALIIPIVICVVLGVLVWWQLLNDFSNSP